VKIVAIIVNFFFPGLGTLLIGQIGTGVAQLLLTIVAAVMIATGVLSIIGIPLGIGVWIWALVSAAKSEVN